MFGCPHLEFTRLLPHPTHDSPGRAGGGSPGCDVLVREAGPGPGCD
jgi:hypothetical protein